MLQVMCAQVISYAQQRYRIFGETIDIAVRTGRAKAAPEGGGRVGGGVANEEEPELRGTRGRKGRGARVWDVAHQLAHGQRMALARMHA